MPEQPTAEKALEILASAAAQYRGTRDEHALLVRCAEILAAHLAPRLPEKL